MIAERERTQVAASLVSGLEIKAASLKQSAAELSGGNQQKVVVGRALALEPRVLVLIAPTAGVDVAAKISLFAIIDRARAEGTACLMVSDELDELVRCDRILVIFNGRCVAEFGRGWTEEDLVGAIEGITEVAAA
jgi:simple sugar transport system ATP-binding protein